MGKKKQTTFELHDLLAEAGIFFTSLLRGSL